MARLCNLSITVPAENVDELRVKLNKAVEDGSLYEFLEIAPKEVYGDASDDDGEAGDDGDAGNFPPDEEPDLSGIDAPNFGDDNDER